MQNNCFSLICPIQIPTPFAVGDVYSYLIIDEKNVLVDCGHYADYAFSVVSKKLKEHGLRIKDLDEIWLTHAHPDHFGQARKIANRSAAVVYGHRGDRLPFAGNNDEDLFLSFFASQNIPNHFTTHMIEQIDWLHQYQQPVEPEWIKQGDQLKSGQLSFNVQFTPGHSAGHVVFQSDQGIIFGGDLLLDHISTNAFINFDPDTGLRNKSLLQYRQSLKWIRKQQGTVFAGHGKVIENIPSLASHHLDEHVQRYQKICQLLEQQPMSLMDICYKIFLDAIKGGAIFLVLSEVIGYLDWGLEEKVIGLDDGKNPVYYMLKGESTKKLK